MLSYKDRTFCAFFIECAHGEECGRALTDAVREGAEQADMPISQFMYEPECYEGKE